MGVSLEAFPTADLFDAHPDRARRLTAPMRDFGGQRRFAGRIRTAVTMEDTGLLRNALYGTPGNGAVAVVDGGGSLRTALLGDLNAALLVENGWAGILINGAVRDVAALAGLNFGIKALGTSPARPGRTGLGAIGVPVAFGNLLLEPGQCVYCDEDGILVSDDPLEIPP